MGKRQERLIYLAFGSVILGLFVYLVIEARAAVREIPISTEPSPPTRVVDLEKESVIGLEVFERDLQECIVKPLPTATPEMKPTATPTPFPFPDWKLEMILPPLVSFVDESGRMVHKEKGDEHYGFLILEVNGVEETMIVKCLKDGLGRTKTYRRAISR